MIVKYLVPAFCLVFITQTAMAGLFNGRPSKLSTNVEDDAPWQEAIVPLADFPSSFDWREITMPNEVSQRIFIDSQSIQIGSDKAIRFTLRQLSSKGAENISREGALCSERTLRSYAFADMTGKRWIEASKGKWLKPGLSDYFRHTLLTNLCPGAATPFAPEDILSNLNKQEAKPRKN